MLNNGISSPIYSLLNNEEFRPTTNLVISTCPASDYLSNIKPNLEKITTNYYETFSITNKFTGYFPDVTVGEFFNTLSDGCCGGTAILGGLNESARKKSENSESSEKSESSDNSERTILSEKDESVVTNPEDLTAGSSSIQGKRGTENIGIAVFDTDKLCGKLTATETICHLLIENKVDSSVISIDNPFQNGNAKEKIELSISPITKSHINVNIEDNIPNIYLEINIQASILTLEDNIEYEETETLDKFSSATENYLEKDFSNYFNKISKELCTDIDCFSYKALAHFNTKQEWENYNWKEKFKSAKFHTNIKVNIISSQMITKT